MNIQTSEKMAEVHRRLQEEENQKARALLATAMSHLEALRVMQSSISKKMNGVNVKR